MMRLRQLEVFRAVMAHGTVTAAARALRMSQPAATTAIRVLESSLGLDLFQRDKGRLAATPEAVFVSMVDNLDAKMGMVQRALRNAGENDEFSEYLPGLKAPVLLRPPVA